MIEDIEHSPLPERKINRAILVPADGSSAEASCAPRANSARCCCGGLVRLARRSCISLVLPLSLAIVTVVEAWLCARQIPGFIKAGWRAEIRAAKNQWRV